MEPLVHVKEKKLKIKKHGRLFGTQEYYLIIQFPADSKLSGNSS